MSALDTLDDLGAWLDARSEIVDAWLSCCELTAAADDERPEVRAPVRSTAACVPAFAGSLFGADGGQSSGGGSSGPAALAA